MSLTPERALHVGKNIICGMPLFVVIHKHNTNGSKNFSVLVASPVTGKISDVTNYFAIAAGIKLIDKKGSDLFHAQCNPGYNIQDFVNEKWEELTGLDIVKPEIVVTVSGGVVQDVDVPFGCEVIVKDYDVDKDDEDVMEDDEGKFLQTVWTCPMSAKPDTK